MPILSIFTIQSSAFCQWQNFYWIQILDFWKLKCLFIDFDLNPNILLVNLKILMRIYLLKLRPHSAYRGSGYDSKWHPSATWSTWLPLNKYLRPGPAQFGKLEGNVSADLLADAFKNESFRVSWSYHIRVPPGPGAWVRVRVCRITGSWKRKPSDTYIWLIFRVLVVIFGMICEICVGIFKNAGMETNLGRGPAPRTRKMLFCQGNFHHRWPRWP